METITKQKVLGKRESNFQNYYITQVKCQVFKPKVSSPTKRGYKPVIPLLGKLGQLAHKFQSKASLGNLMRPCLKIKRKEKGWG